MLDYSKDKCDDWEIVKGLLDSRVKTLDD